MKTSEDGTTTVFLGDNPDKEQELADTLANWHRRATFDKAVGGMRALHLWTCIVLMALDLAQLPLYLFGVATIGFCYGVFTTSVVASVMMSLFLCDLINKARRA